MDWVKWKQGAQRYKYVALILLVGIFLMVLPEGKPPETVQQPESREVSLQASLTQILSRVAGAGRVEVLLTESAGERVLYQTDEDASRSENGEDIRRSTVLITNGSREETGLVRQILPPTYQGAIVLSQGAGDARVRLAIVQAVMSVTGLTADKITVLKMK